MRGKDAPAKSESKSCINMLGCRYRTGTPFTLGDIDMGVYRKNETWWIDFYYQGKRYRQKIGTKKKTLFTHDQ